MPEQTAGQGSGSESGLYSSPMTVSHAREIARWSYAPPYDFYDMGEDDETVEELMRYTAVLKGDGLFGFYCLGS